MGTIAGLQGQQAEALRAAVERRLDMLAVRVSERLDKGFRMTNETFVSVMQRLA
jgi:DNA recombination protein RmuC